MTEVLLRHYASDLFNAFSAGADPKGMNPLTVKVMNEIGISVGAVFQEPVRVS